MNAYQSFYETYRDIADIYILYILEAHFVEKDDVGKIIGGWPIGKLFNYPQHKTLQDRCAMVEVLLNTYHPTIPILLDTMANEFQNAYRPWPDRAYVFHQGHIQYMARINDDGSRNAMWCDEIAPMLDAFRTHTD